MMVALHAGRRGDWSVVADLLDGHVAEDHDSDELRMLARAFVNDSPIRQRALRFFARLTRPFVTFHSFCTQKDCCISTMVISPQPRRSCGRRSKRSPNWITISR